MKSANDGGRGQDNDDDDDDNDGEEEVDDNDNDGDDGGRGQDNAASHALLHLSWQSQNMGSRHFLRCIRIAGGVLYAPG